MKKIISFILVCMLLLGCGGCNVSQTAGNEPFAEKDPQLSDMRAICQLATIECYYHNVAKYFQEDASGVWIWKKDKHFWIEYSGIVRMGIDATKVQMTVEDNKVNITIPKAYVINAEPDEESLNEEAFYIAQDSAKVEAADQQAAFKEAQDNMEEQASNDRALLANAQQRAQKLLEDYVNNIGTTFGKKYEITWTYLDEI